MISSMLVAFALAPMAGQQAAARADGQCQSPRCADTAPARFIAGWPPRSWIRAGAAWLLLAVMAALFAGALLLAATGRVP